MKKITFLLCVTLHFVVSCFSQENGMFISLFNGKDLSSWTLEKPDGFEVDNGELLTRCLEKEHDDLYTKKKYGNFILRFEFKLSKVGNSGVFLRCETFNQSAGYEVQLLAPWTPWRDDLHCTGSIYGHVAVKDRPDETTGIWHKMEIKCDRNIITISVDDKVTTAANIDTVKTMVNKPFIGVIGLQANHVNGTGQDARFRNIYIRDLDAEPDYVIKGFYEKNDKLRNLAQVAAVGLGAKIIQPLADLMSDGTTMAKDGAKKALFDLIAKSTAKEASRKDINEVKQALKSSVKNTSDDITKNYLIWLHGMIASK